MDRPPLIVSPYDAELFGHWWYEGPMFLDFLIRKIHYDQDDVKLVKALQKIDLPLTLAMFLFYFIGGYLLYSSLLAAIGSAVDSEADTQQIRRQSLR